MSNLLVQSFRKGILSISLSVLLCFAIGFSIIGVCSWSFMQDQAEAINAKYVTIAIPKEQEMDKWDIGGTYMEDGSIEWNDGTWYISPSRLETIAINAPGLQFVDRRCLLSAHVSGETSLSSGALDTLQYNEVFDRYSYNFCVLAVRCVDVSDASMAGEILEDGTLCWGIGSYDVNFEIVDIVSRLDTYDLPPENDMLYLYQDIRTEDGEIPFEEGNTYLIRGFYTDYPIIEVVDEDNHDNGLTYVKKRYNPESASSSDMHDVYAERRFALIPDTAPFYTLFSNIDVNNLDAIGIGQGLPHFTLNEAVSNEEDYMLYKFLPEGSLPLYAQYSGDWQDYLNTPEGSVWKDKIIPMAEINHESATVILTDHLESMYAFNTGEAVILEGRSFTQTDYSGANVCLISAAYAEYNNLSVGDTIHLDFYDSGYALEQGETRGATDIIVGNTITRFPLVEETRIGVEKDYEIVGIYTSPGFSFGAHSFHSDTIFVPKASVPNAGNYENTGIELLSSFILENGMVEDFEEYMINQNMGDLFLYFDQEFDDTAETLNTLIQNAFRLLLVSSFIFVLVVAVFAFLHIRMMAPAARGMRLLGISSKKVQVEAARTMLIWTSSAVFLGVIVGISLFDIVTANILSEYVTLDGKTATACVATQCVILFITEIISTYILSHPKLMQTSR